MSRQINLKYRLWNSGIAPRRTKLEVPGWAGDRKHHHEFGQPYDCPPFVSAATYFLEVLYPFSTEVTVTTDENGVSHFHYDSDEEWTSVGTKLPFGHFAPYHFGFTFSVDIQTEKDFALLVIPHARFFTDTTGEVPCTSIAILDTNWWSKIFFIAYKSPPIGGKYIFRKNEGIASVMVVPKEITYNIQKMTSQEQKDREEQEKAIMSRPLDITTRKWTDRDGNTFDNKYKVLSALEQKKQGGATERIKQMIVNEENNKETQAEMRRNKLTRRLIMPITRRKNDN